MILIIIILMLLAGLSFCALLLGLDRGIIKTVTQFYWSLAGMVVAIAIIGFILFKYCK